MGNELITERPSCGDAAIDGPPPLLPRSVLEAHLEDTGRPAVDVALHAHAAWSGLIRCHRALWLGWWWAVNQVQAETALTVTDTQNGNPNVLTQFATFELHPWETRMPNGAWRGPVNGSWNVRADEAWYRNMAAGIGSARALVIEHVDLPFARQTRSTAPERIDTYGARVLSATSGRVAPGTSTRDRSTCRMPCGSPRTVSISLEAQERPQESVWDAPPMWRERSQRLVGRDPALRSLLDQLAAARGGAVRLAIVEGEAGIGKSALLHHLAQAARAEGATVLRGVARPLERSRPFGPLVDALGLRIDATDTRHASIARLLAGEDREAAAPLGPGQLQFVIVEQMVDLLESLTAGGPVLLELDDLHWADGATLQAVERVIRRLQTVPLVLVTAVRPAPRSAELSRLLEDAVGFGAMLVRLEPLGETDAEQLAQERLGVPLAPSMSMAVRRAGGNPLWLVELLRSLADEERIDRSSGVAELRSGDLPGSIRELVLNRLRELPDTSARALRTASLLGESFSLIDMATITGRRVTDLVDDIGPAFSAGLIADHRGMLSFRHQLVRDAIYESLPEAVRVALHRAAADALTRSGAPPQQVATHLMLGAIPPDSTAAASLREAASILAPSAAAVAVELLRRAVDLLPDEHPERDRMLLALAECEQRIGAIQRSIDLADSVLTRPHEEGLTLPLRFVVISGLSLQGRGEELIQQTTALLDDPRASPGERARALGLSGSGWVVAGDPRAGELATRQGLELAERTSDHSMLSWNLNMLGSSLIAQGRYAEAIECTSRATAIALEPPDLQARRRIPHMVHGMALSQADRFPEALAAFRTAAAECTAVGSWMLEADIQLLSAEVRLARGEWREAATEIETHLRFARERTNLITVPRFCGHLALVCAARGDVAGGHALLGAFPAELTSQRPRFGAEFLVHAAAMLAEVAGDPGTAIDRLRHFLAQATEWHNLNGHRFITPALTRLALRTDQREVAHEAVTAAEQAATVAPEVPSVRAAALRCRGLWESSPELMDEAIRLTEASGRALDLAGACEDAAAVLAARGARTDARRQLEMAVDRYEALEATWLAARATATHRSLGGRRGARGPRDRAESGWQSLTRSERAVADLVAEGLTNREIGARLFISPHTVNSHLRQAFQKLGVSTRAGLAAAVSSDPARHGPGVLHSNE